MSAAAAGLSKVEAVPNRAMALKISTTLSQPSKVPHARNPAVSAWTYWQICTMRLRLYRSATWPAANTKRALGINCTSPTMPRANALPVSAYTCHPMATVPIWYENSENARADTKNRKGRWPASVVIEALLVELLVTEKFHD